MPSRAAGADGGEAEFVAYRLRRPSWFESNIHTTPAGNLPPPSPDMGSLVRRQILVV
jgi:hypothetical protein